VAHPRAQASLHGQAGALLAGPEDPVHPAGAGAFFIFALIAIWVSYDNSIVALVALGWLGAAVLAALCYPDARLSRKVGPRGVLVSLISNLIILGVAPLPCCGSCPAGLHLGGVGFPRPDVVGVPRRHCAGHARLLAGGTPYLRRDRQPLNGGSSL